MTTPRDAIDPALRAVLEGLKLARREAAGLDGDAERWRWIAVGVVTALKAAAIAALSAYDTAKPDDVADPADAGRMAPLALLLRRTRSDRYLAAPEQLAAPLSQVEAALRLAAYRNAVVHGGGAGRPDTIAEDCRSALGLIRHFTVTAPAFGMAGHGVIAALAADELTALERSLAQAG